MDHYHIWRGLSGIWPYGHYYKVLANIWHTHARCMVNIHYSYITAHCGIVLRTCIGHAYLILLTELNCARLRLTVHFIWITDIYCALLRFAFSLQSRPHHRHM